MHITISIERLMLDGIDIPHRLRHQLQAAVEAELTRLLLAGGLAAELRTGGTRHRVPAGVLELREDDGPDMLGKKIARAVYRGIGQ